MSKVLAALLTCLVLASCADTPAGPGAKAGDAHVDVDTAQLRDLKAKAGVADCPTTSEGSSELPEVTLRCLGGGRDVDLSALRGPLVINLFAQWCGPCRKELPYYEALHRKGEGTVRVIGVDYLDTQPAAALELVRETGVTYPLLADPEGQLRSDLKVRGLPGVVFVDEDGNVTTEFRVVKSYAELRGLVQDRLDVRLPA